jgi:hypothetical protein
LARRELRDGYDAGLSLLVATALTIGFVLARRELPDHRVVQTAAAATSLVLVLWLMILPFRDFIIPGCRISWPNASTR